MSPIKINYVFPSSSFQVRSGGSPKSIFEKVASPEQMLSVQSFCRKLSVRVSSERVKVSVVKRGENSSVCELILQI